MTIPTTEQIYEAALHLLLKERGSGVLLSYDMVRALALDPRLSTDERVELVHCSPKPPNEGVLVALVRS